ncbi:hypothetical protein P152DRAFT_472078 [Eremomyces bilateralis CBS 781.70]|uniref:ABM domain-containing protein n=1 Tax=Eremomyces bilateralis CBS 781.70 TaxID=1392243 RepID=A0A6G1G8E7_9PEZI|nr:uncharacterized protein P152DRAFT_472078 [Eremomyces bilateralis CBS 781.70]KAF1814303.1 hypothetical protein P152DRAFT_472078 [Eremomyces bilateralis CBS 781.70]
MVLAKPTSRCTQMILLKVPVQHNLREKTQGTGAIWWKALAVLQKSPGFVRVYFGRRVEIPDSVHLHVVRETLEQSQDFLKSPLYQEFKSAIDQLTNVEPTIRHAFIGEYSPGCESLAKGAPVTGTAIYVDLQDLWDERWDQWTGIVPKVEGFMGIAGGPLVESVAGFKDCYIALVGWKNVEVHDTYHHTADFASKSHILLDPGRSKKKFTEYGHIAFESDLVVEADSASKL